MTLKRRYTYLISVGGGETAFLQLKRRVKRLPIKGQDTQKVRRNISPKKRMRRRN